MSRWTLIETISRSIKWKLVAMITCILLAMILSIAHFTYNKTTETIEKDTVEFSNQILRQVNLNLDRYLVGYQQSFLNIAMNSATEKWLAVAEGDDLASYLAFQNIVNDYLQLFIYYHPEMLSLTFYNVNGNEMHFTNRYGLNDDYEFDDEQFMEKLEGQDGIYFDVTFSDNYVNKDLPVLTMVKKVTSRKNTGYIKLDIDLAPAVDIVNDVKLGTSGLTLVSDAEGKIIAHPDLQRVTTYLELDMIALSSEGSGSFLYRSGKEIVIYQTVPYTNWKLFSIIPYYEFTESVLHIRQITLGAVLIGLVLSIVMIIVLSSSFTRRIGVMKHVMSKTKLGNFSERVIVKGKDEIADLGNTYNMMLDHLENSVHQLAESELQQQTAILSALQSQIDSHFLYNSLETINSMANLSNQKDIEQITVALSRMLRYTSDFKNTVVTVDDEIRHLQHYLQIHQIRFGEKISYSLQIDESCKSAQCLKAILQPIVENSIRHNIDVNGKPLHIDVKVTEFDQQFVKADIIDNGMGFDKGKIAELQNEIDSLNAGHMDNSSKRIGILNVHYRLSVYYKTARNAGIIIANREDVPGAKISVIFPLKSSL